MASPTTAAPQIKRVARFFRKFSAIDSGLVHDRPSEEYEDAIYGFFVHSWHLKDWIKHDPALAGLPNVERFVAGEADLLICADICNANKHCVLTQPHRSAVKPAMGSKHYSVGLTVGEEPVLSAKFEIDTDAGPLDAFTVATKCVAAWSRFLGLDVESYDLS